MAEFTGERVIPGLVDTNLFNEHQARYRFALRFVHNGSAVLDAGCGSGYGAAELAAAASVTAIDVAADALEHARNHFGNAGIRFLQAACEALPLKDASFDLIAAFEVIEHLESWQQMLTEANRVLKSSGVLLVSTPNKAYYAESRAKAGPNPFHCHEFTHGEFQSALSAVFPHVRMWTQNHAEAIVFAPLDPAGSTLEANGDSTPEHAHFFVAACSHSPIELNDVFAWLPSSANLLREREHHIEKLEGELARKDAWLQKQIFELSGLQRQHESTLSELQRSNHWAEALTHEVKERRVRVEQLQLELSERLKWVETIERNAAREARDQLDWIESLQARIETGAGEIERLNDHLATLEVDLAARAAWGCSLDAQFRQKAEEVQELWREVQELRPVTDRLAEATRELDRLHEERARIANSKWIRLGNKLNLGPVVDAPSS